MCKKIGCKACGKYTWVGCGKHIDEAMDGVEPWDKCTNWEKGYAHPCGGVKTLYELNQKKAEAQGCLPVNTK